MSQSTSPLVSLIVPVYNVEDYIDECLSSITKQSYHNIEIILVEDAASDGSAARCDHWAKKDNRVRVIHKTINEGLNFARRDGVRASSGQWISFVDSDDIVNQDYIQSMLEVAIQDKVDIVICRNQKFVSSDKIDYASRSEGVKTISDKDKIIRHALVNSPDPDVFMITGWGKLFSHSIVQKIDWDLSNARSNEDELEAIQFYDIQERGVAIVKKVLYYYRDNPNSIMNKPYTNVYGKKNFSRFEWIEELYKTTNKYFGKSNPYVDEILYHNVLLNLLFLNRDITKGVFTDSDAEVFIKNAYPKITEYKKIATKYPLKYEEERAYNCIAGGGGLYSFWHDDRKRLYAAYKHSAELQRHGEELQKHNATLQKQVNELENSKAYKLGRAITKPYVRIRKLLRRS